MAAREIVTKKHPALRKTTAPVTHLTDEVKVVITDLMDTLAATNELGVGLSANQIAQNVRIFIAKITDNEDDLSHIAPTVFINPELIHSSKETTLDADPERQQLEGCLSLPNIYAFIERPLHVTFRYHTLNTFGSTDPIEQKFSDYNAIVVQHELDHLNGILFTDHALEQNQKLYEIIDGKDPRIITL